jgi:hypothetical protein
MPVDHGSWEVPQWTPVDPGPPRHPKDPIVRNGPALVALEFYPMSALQTCAPALLGSFRPGSLPTRQETVR